MDTEFHSDWIENEETSLTKMISPAQHAVLDYGEPEAKFFYGQAASEAGVIATTDWSAA